MTIRRETPLAAAALVTLAVACGGGGGKAAPGTSTEATGAVYQPSNKPGGTLTLLADSDCDYWDPQRTYYGNCWNLQRFYQRQLVTYAAKPGSARLVPDLATAVPASTDGIHWTYTLKPGIMFEDGTPITAKDVKYGIERAFAQDVINGGPTYVKDFLDDPKNPYPGPYKDRSPARLGLQSVATPDDHTITFTLHKKFADWNYVMALPDSTPVPQAKDTGARYTFHPVASGPYKIARYTPNKAISFVRNPAWDRHTDPVRKALPDRIEVTEGLDLTDIDNRIIADQADLDVGQTGVQAAAQAKIRYAPAGPVHDLPHRLPALPGRVHPGAPV